MDAYCCGKSGWNPNDRGVDRGGALLLETKGEANVSVCPAWRRTAACSYTMRYDGHGYWLIFAVSLPPSLRRELWSITALTRRWRLAHATAASPRPVTIRQASSPSRPIPAPLWGHRPRPGPAASGLGSTPPVRGQTTCSGLHPACAIQLRSRAPFRALGSHYASEP